MTDLRAPDLPDTQRAGAPPPSRLARVAALATRSMTGLVWFGVAVVAAGFILIFIAWGKVAGTLNVGVQMPWIVSAGFTGLGLVLVGIGIANGAVRHQDSAERERQLGEIRDALVQLRATLDDGGTSA